MARDGNPSPYGCRGLLGMARDKKPFALRMLGLAWHGEGQALALRMLRSAWPGEGQALALRQETAWHGEGQALALQ